MRRTIINITLASLLGFAVAGCSDKAFSTSPLIGPRSDAAKPPGGGGSTPPSPPITLPPRSSPDDFADITAGDNHTCARKNNGTVYCWGADFNGQSGASVTATCVTGVVCINRPTQLLFQGGAAVLAIQLDAGSNHTCMLDVLQDAYCWGDGNNGQVGFSSGAKGPQPWAVKVDTKEKFLLIRAGGQSTCASGTTGVYCWGVINGGTNPQIIAGYGSTNALAVGDLHVCIIDNSGSHGILCLGSNQNGQLGMVPSGQSWFSAFTPSGFGPANSVTAQLGFTCSDQIDGTVQCAGDNTYGQLGSSVPGFSGLPQSVGGGAALHGVSTGPQHACALDRNSLAYCWGDGANGKLGNGTQDSSSTPKPVSGGRTYRAIAAGGQHTCAIGTDNAIYCWGANQYGQLGEATSQTYVVTTPWATAAPK